MRREHTIPEGAELIFHVNGLVSGTDIINNVTPTFNSYSGNITSQGIYLESTSNHQIAAARYSSVNTPYGSKLENSNLIHVEYCLYPIWYKSNPGYGYASLGQCYTDNTTINLFYGNSTTSAAYAPENQETTIYQKLTHDKNLIITRRKIWTTSNSIIDDNSVNLNLNKTSVKNNIYIGCGLWAAGGFKIYLKSFKVYVS